MSPAAVDIQSPTASRENLSSVSESRSSTSGFDFGEVFPGFGGGDFRRSDSVAPGKARPRLVKVRKQVGLRTKSGNNPFGGFNPFGGETDRRNVTREAEKAENLGFVFAARENNPKPELSAKKEEPVANGTEYEPGKSKCSQFTKSLSPEAEVFVFGANDVKKFKFNLGSNLEKSESSANIGSGFRSSKSDTGATPFEFVKSSTSETKPFSEVKLSGESARNLSKFAEVNKLDPDLGLRLNSSYESSDIKKASVSCTSSVFKLPDEMGKLNIDNTVRTKLPHSFGDLFKSTRHKNVNRGSNKVSDFSTTHKGTTPSDRTSEGYSLNAEKVSGNASGSVKQNGVSCPSGSEAFSFKAGLGETNKDDQNEKGLGVDYSYRQPNLASSSCNYPTESVSSVEEKNHQDKSSITPDRFCASSMDSGTPLCDPCSLRESLFPNLINTPLVKNRSARDKRLKESKRKLRKPLVKPCPDKDNASKESSLQEDTNSSECYSPMDFSPYQASVVTNQCPKETPEPPTQSKIDDGIPSVSAFVNGAHVTPEDSSGIKNQEETRTQFVFMSGLDDKTKSCMFSPTSAGQVGVPARRHRYRRRSRIGVGNDTFVITPSTNSKPRPSTLSQKEGNSSSEVHETCEIWRMRGNEAYKNGDISRAEVLYTQGIVCVPSSERSGDSLEALLLCYSNRAAARMRLQRVREAIGDCTMAIALDPKFLKAQMRAANCHLLLGEIKHASVYFNKCQEVGSGVCLDRRIIVDAADGLLKAQKIAQCTEQSARLLEEKNYDAALRSLGIISEALSVSSYSENLLRLKAEALIMLRRYEEAVQLCEDSVSFAEKNFSSDNANGNHFVRLWRWFLTARSYFLLGKFEGALPLLDKLKQVGSSNNESARMDIESATSLETTIRLLSDTKNAGNEAFKSGRYSEAIEHYTVALSNNVGSRHFAAVCFCNRAAAHQVLGQISDAIADCSLAIALDGNYTKALSRRATLHEMVRDYGQAASDLQRLVSVLESQPCNKSKQSSSSGRSTASAKELRQAQTRLPVMEQEAKSGTSLNFYLILGSKSNDSSADIKKAYRKAALKHHPDKAGQFLARSDNGDEGRLWKEIAEEVHKDADRLFKIIGEAYTILSNSSKRSEYDLDEELRRSCKLNSGSTAQRRQSDCHYSSRSGSYRKSDFGSSPFGGSYKRNSKDNWKTYGDSYSKW